MSEIDNESPFIIALYLVLFVLLLMALIVCGLVLLVTIKFLIHLL